MPAVVTVREDLVPGTVWAKSMSTDAGHVIFHKRRGEVFFYAELSGKVLRKTEVTLPHPPVMN